MPNLYCLGCSKKALGSCPCCKDTHYCSEECQKFDWKLNHFYENYLLKATGDEKEVSSTSGEKNPLEERGELLKFRQTNERLRKEFVREKERVQDALTQRERSKWERGLTHEQRKIYAFHLITGLKNVSGKDENQYQKERVEFLANLHFLCDEVNKLPRADGGERQASMGMRERVELVNLFRMRDILREKEKLLFILNTREISLEVSAYKKEVQERENRFTFGLLFREGDSLDYQASLAKDRENRAEHLTDSWMRENYKLSVQQTSDVLEEFLRENEGDEGVKERHPTRMTKEEREEELEYFLLKLKLVKKSAIDTGITLLEKRVKKGEVEESQARGTKDHYRRISERVDNLLFTKSGREEIMEDVERMLRGRMGREDWHKLKFLLEDGNYQSQVVEKFAAKSGLSGKLWDTLFSPTKKQAYLGSIIIFWGCLFLIHFINYFIGFNAMRSSVDQDARIFQARQSVMTKTLKNITDTRTTKQAHWDTMCGSLLDLMDQLNTTGKEFFQFADMRIAGQNLTAEQEFIVQGVIDKETVYIEEAISSGNFSKSAFTLDNAKRFLDVLRIYNTSEIGSQEKTQALTDISLNFQLQLGGLQAANLTVGDRFISDMSTRITNSIGLIDMTENLTNQVIEQYEKDLTGFGNEVTNFTKKLDHLRHGSPNFHYYFTDWNVTAQTVTPWVTGLAYQPYYIASELFNAMGLDLAITEAASFASYREIPYDPDNFWANDILGLATAFRHPQVYIASYYLICSQLYSLYRGVRSWGVWGLGKVIERLLGQYKGVKYKSNLSQADKIKVERIYDDLYLSGKEYTNQEISDKVSLLWINGELSVEQAAALNWKMDMTDIQDQNYWAVQFEKLKFITNEFFSRGVEPVFMTLSVLALYSYTQENWQWLNAYVNAFLYVFPLIVSFFVFLFTLPVYLVTDPLQFLVFYLIIRICLRLGWRGYRKMRVPELGEKKDPDFTLWELVPGRADLDFFYNVPSKGLELVKKTYNNGIKINSQFLLSILPMIWRYHRQLKTLGQVLIIAGNLNYYEPWTEKYNEVKNSLFFGWGNLQNNIRESVNFGKFTKEMLSKTEVTSQKILGLMTKYDEILDTGKIDPNLITLDNYTTVFKGLDKALTTYTTQASQELSI